jgi:hypothetical protein
MRINIDDMDDYEQLQQDARSDTRARRCRHRTGDPDCDCRPERYDYPEMDDEGDR